LVLDPITAGFGYGFTAGILCPILLLLVYIFCSDIAGLCYCWVVLLFIDWLRVQPYWFGNCFGYCPYWFDHWRLGITWYLLAVIEI
jgi:hypothetical protein